jgi:hypothetical protein
VLNATARYPYEFVVKNTTNRTVRITGHRVTCTCTDVRIDPTELRPEETGRLAFDVHLPRAATDRVISCELLTDHPEYPEWTYPVSMKTYQYVESRKPTNNLGDEVC